MDDLDRVIGDLQDELKRLYRAIERQGKSADKVKQQYHDAQLKMDALLAYKRPIKSTGDIIRRSNRAMARWISPVSYTHLDVYKRQVMEKFYFKDESDYKKSIKICLYGSILLITPLLLTFFVHGIIQ